MSYMEKIDPSCGMRRFYDASVDPYPNLFGQYVFVRNWGRIGTFGQRKEEWFSDAGAAAAAQAKIIAGKQRRGYQASSRNMRSQRSM